ncbi:hypothetical protein SipoB123_06015 [Streptomyces ipomoeae]|nr:hypothetical protein SipoB123_06015 [Streptomyces ipomoeae]
MGCPDQRHLLDRPRILAVPGSLADFWAVPLECLAGDGGDALEVPVAAERALQKNSGSVIGQVAMSPAARESRG